MKTRIGTMVGTLANDVETINAQMADYLGISVMGLHILDQLFQENGRKATDLAHSVGRAPTAFTPSLDKLEKAGLICRTPHPKDRRAILVFLTPEGEKLRQDVIGHMDVVGKRVRETLLDRINTSNASDILENFFAPLPEYKPF